MDINCDVYAFGNFESGYTQYPLDYAKGIFQSIYSKSTAPTQLAVERSGNMMYYTYIRKLDAEQYYMGFCVLLNGVKFTKPCRLFQIFEETVESLVTDSEILGFNLSGNLIPYVESLTEKQYEIGVAISNINAAVEKLLADNLPVLKIGVPKTSRHFLFEEADEDKVVSAIADGGLTFIDKNKDYDTKTLAARKETFLEAVKNGTINPSKIGPQGKLSIRGTINRLFSSIRKELL